MSTNSDINAWHTPHKNNVHSSLWAKEKQHVNTALFSCTHIAQNVTRLKHEVPDNIE